MLSEEQGTIEKILLHPMTSVIVNASLMVLFGVRTLMFLMQISNSTMSQKLSAAKKLGA